MRLRRNGFGGFRKSLKKFRIPKLTDSISSNCSKFSYTPFRIKLAINRTGDQVWTWTGDIKTGRAINFCPKNWTGDKKICEPELSPVLLYGQGCNYFSEVLRNPNFNADDVPMLFFQL